MSSIPRYITFRPQSRSRLDQAIAASGEGVSRRQARRLLEKKRVLLNGSPVSAASREVGPSDRIIAVTDDFALDLVAVTSGWVAVNKPSGIASQPSRDRARLSLSDLVALRLREERSSDEVFIVHRLDTGTSGVILYARGSQMAAALSKPFAEGTVGKRYLAIVHGRVLETLEIESVLGRVGETMFGDVESGRRAVSRVVPLAVSDHHSLVEVMIATGRTHQIRVHLAGAGHPVAGDRKYGDAEDAASRLMLHAAELCHPIAGDLVAPVGEDMTRFAVETGVSKAL